jgi:hypothetical protein
MLVDQEYTDVFPLPCEAVESILYLRLFGLGIHHQKVAFRIGRIRDMPYASEEQSCDRAGPVSICPYRVLTECSLFIANDRNELTVLPDIRARVTTACVDPTL